VYQLCIDLVVILKTIKSLLNNKLIFLRKESIMERETAYLNVKTRRITLMTEKIVFAYKNGMRYIQRDQNFEPEYDIVG